jgi:transmembrane sensor
MEWLQADPRHAEAMAQHAAALERMMGLYEWQPALSSAPNPDLFAPPVRPRRSLWFGALAAAAAVALVLATWWVVPATFPVEMKSHLRVNERRVLADGSLVELRDGSRIDVEFTDAERRVQLQGGEAHFTVEKNPARPFIVEAGGVTVRAVGTAFNVRLEAEAVAVLVTHGKVEVAPPAAAPLPLSMGEQTVVLLTNEPAAGLPTAPQVVQLSRDQMQVELAWQTPRLQFFETPLGDAVAEFNRHAGGRRLQLEDADLGHILIGGTFRVDNPDGFVRLLEVTVDVHGEPSANGVILLRRAH